MRGEARRPVRCSAADRLVSYPVAALADVCVRIAVVCKEHTTLPELPDAKRLEKIAKPWRPYRTLACLYLWSSLDNTPG